MACILSAVKDASKFLTYYKKRTTAVRNKCFIQRVLFHPGMKRTEPKMVDIDSPLAKLIPFSRSIYEITNQVETSYFDSLSGIFFSCLEVRFF
jgi:hypothetical protein